MKRYLLFGMVLMILLLCVGCAEGEHRIVDFKPEDVLSVEVYDVHGSSSKQKIVTAEKDIKTIIDTLSSIKIKGDGAKAEPTVGGAIQFVFNKTDNSQLAITYDGTSIKSLNDYWYEVESKSNLFDLWEQMKYDTQDVQEYELPFCPKDKVPYLGLRYKMREDYYNLNALLGTYSWHYDNADGTMTGVEADSLHPLDAVKDLPIIIKSDDMNEIELIFSMPPDSYTVRCWLDKYLGDAQANEQYYEMVDVSNNVIALPDDGNGYVYEVHATWQQGNAYYSFYVK